MPKSKKTVQPLLLTLLREGLSHRQAARSAGINPVTFYRWLKEDDDFRTAVETLEAAPGPPTPPYQKPA